MRDIARLSASILFLLLALYWGAEADPVGSIDGIEIPGLIPFQLTFVFTNDGPTPMEDVVGQATLMDRFGKPIEGISIEPFSAPAGARVKVTARSRWDFQRTGIYLLEVSLDLGGGRFLANSLAFRILPVRLPLAPEKVEEGEGLYTVYQQPVDWGLGRIHAQRAWEISHGDESVVVAVIDSGIDRSIPQLAEGMWVNEDEIPGNGIDDDHNGYVDDVNGWDFRDDDNSSLSGTPIHGHGTAVASIIGARPGELPIVGVAPGVRLMDVRFLDSANKFRSSDWKTFVRAIEYAVDNGADIINLSIYANGKPPGYFEDALRRAVAQGVIIVGISGNEGKPEVMYPGKYPYVYAVAATTEDDLLAGFSNRGPEVSFSAPGEKITSFTKGGRAVTRSGTSFAAPHVTGVLALILSAFPGISPTDAVDLMRETADDLGAPGPDDWYGNGLVDAWEALRSFRR
ncbi:hypothetical protein DRJ24_00400 [Candidatus Acetothermia bacterium]|nr:MAG: hypothetical protein DRJ24_00400 [Candidatus Acetothermia bacterium]